MGQGPFPLPARSWMGSTTCQSFGTRAWVIMRREHEHPVASETPRSQSEVCVQYVKAARFDGMTADSWHSQHCRCCGMNAAHRADCRSAWPMRRDGCPANAADQAVPRGRSSLVFPADGSPIVALASLCQIPPPTAIAKARNGRTSANGRCAYIFRRHDYRSEVRIRECNIVRRHCSSWDTTNVWTISPCRRRREGVSGDREAPVEALKIFAS